MKKRWAFAKEEVSLERGSHFQEKLEGDPILMELCTSEVIPHGTQILLDKPQFCNLHDPNGNFCSAMLKGAEINGWDETQAERLVNYLTSQKSPLTLYSVMISADGLMFSFTDSVVAKNRQRLLEEGREDIADSLASLEDRSVSPSGDNDQLNGVKFTITSSNGTNATFHFISAKRYEIALSENGEEKLITVSQGRENIHVRVK